MKERILLSLLTPALSAGLALAQGPVMGTSVDLLDFRITDAEFAVQSGRIVAVSNAPSQSLHVYDPLAQSGVELPLPLSPTCVSVGPDGTEAVVGHDGWITHVDLRTISVIDTIPCSTNVGDVVLAGNGFAYAFAASGQWGNIRCIELATGVETLHSGRSLYGGTRAKLHPNGLRIYGANNGLSPSDIEKYDVSSGTAVYMYDSPYHGTYSMAGNLWIAENGLRIFVRGGNTFRSSEVQAEDMVYAGRFSDLNLVTWVTDSTETGKVLAIPETPWSGGGPDDRALQVYDAQFLAFEGSYPFPQVTLGGNRFDTHGRFVFFEDDGRRAWAVVRADPTSGLLLDDGIVSFELDPVTPSLTTDVDFVSLGGGGVQNLSLDAGPAHGGMVYLILGSLNGTQPGIPLGGSVHLPLNFEPHYFVHTLTHPDSWPLFDSLGVLDAQGRGTARFDISRNSIPASMVGTVVHHAFVAVGPTGRIVFASNAAPVRFER